MPIPPAGKKMNKEYFPEHPFLPNLPKLPNIKNAVNKNLKFFGSTPKKVSSCRLLRIRLPPVSRNGIGSGFGLEEGFKQFPGGRKLLEIADFGSIIGARTRERS
jgi:hypothetical protein